VSRFNRTFRDGYSISPEKADKLNAEWKKFQRQCWRKGLRPQLNYHGIGNFSVTACPRDNKSTNNLPE